MKYVQQLVIRKDNTADVVHIKPIEAGDYFHDPSTETFGLITEIIEQRKERAIYEDENDRRNWARVKFERTTQIPQQ